VQVRRDVQAQRADLVGRRQQVRHHHRHHAGRGCRTDAVMRILDRQAGLRRDTEKLGRLEERIGMRLVARIVAVCGDAAESPGQPMALQMAFDRRAGRAGRDRARQVELVEQVEQFQHARLQDLLRVG
jgi:hypothetical protein